MRRKRRSSGRNSHPAFLSAAYSTSRSLRLMPHGCRVKVECFFIGVKKTHHVGPRVYVRGVGVSGVRVRSGAGCSRNSPHHFAGPHGAEHNHAEHSCAKRTFAPNTVCFREMELLSGRNCNPDDAGLGCAGCDGFTDDAILSALWKALLAESSFPQTPRCQRGGRSQRRFFFRFRARIGVSRRHALRSQGSFAQDVAAHRLCHHSCGGDANRFRRSDVQLGQGGWRRDERGAVERILPGEEPNGNHWSGELGDGCRRRWFVQSDAGVRAGRRSLDEAASASSLVRVCLREALPGGCIGDSVNPQIEQVVQRSRSIPRTALLATP